MVRLKKKRNKEKHKASHSKVRHSLKGNSSQDNSLSTFSELALRTDVDRLYDAVQKKGVIGLTTASKELHLSLEQTEQYAKVLDKHKLIRLSYPYFGTPKLHKMSEDQK